MQSVKNLLKQLHTIKSFSKHGWKQASTWLGILIFVCIFYNDVLILVHNVLTSETLSEKIAAGLAGAILILFNKHESKDQDR